MKIVITNYVPSLKVERECNECLLDTNEGITPTVFAQLIHTASFIFGNRLILGGAYRVNREDKERILNALIEVEKVLEKYEK